MFSKACQYAIRAVIYIWKQSLNNKKVGAKEISQFIDAPEPFTAKILQVLVKQKIIGSQKGPTGGFFAGVDHEKFLLKDLVITIDGDSLFEGCGMGLKECSEVNPCPLHHEIKKIRLNLMEMLSKKSLKELAEEVESGETVLSRLT